MSDEMRRVMDEPVIRRVIDRYCHAVKVSSKRRLCVLTTMFNLADR